MSDLTSSQFLWVLIGLAGLIFLISYVLRRAHHREPLCPSCRLNSVSRCRIRGRPNVRRCRAYKPTAEGKGFRVIDGGQEGEEGPGGE
jgi:hypothetical protein